MWPCEACNSDEVMRATAYSAAVVVVCGRATKAQATLYTLFYDLSQIGVVSPHSGLPATSASYTTLNFNRTIYIPNGISENSSSSPR